MLGYDSFWQGLVIPTLLYQLAEEKANNPSFRSWFILPKDLNMTWHRDQAQKMNLPELLS